MVWQTLVAAAAVIVAVPTAAVAVAAFRRTARVADVQSVTEAQQVGLEYLRESLKIQQQTIVEQQGQIGQLRGELKGCREERQTMAGQIEHQAAQIADLQTRLT